MQPFLKSTLLLATLLVWTTRGAASGPAPQATASLITVCPAGCDHATVQGAINGAASGDTVQILMTSPLTEADIVVDKDVTIEGIDQTETIVQAAATPGTADARVFTILPGHSATMRSFTVRHGNVTDRDGGGIWVQAGAQLTLEEVTVTLNEAGSGGGIANEGSLTLIGGTVGNNAASFGGGIYNTGELTARSGQSRHRTNGNAGGGIYVEDGSVSLQDVRIANNEGPFSGIYVSDGSLSLQDANITSNHGGLFAVGGSIEGTRLNIGGNEGVGCGGGIAITFSAALTLSESAVAFNRALDGAGLCQSGPDSRVYLTNVTVAQNSAEEDGGGILVWSGVMWLANVTVAENTASSSQPGTYDGGGVFIEDGEVNLRSVIIADNGGVTDYPDCYGTFASASFTLIGDRGADDAFCSWLGFSAGMLSDVDARLDDLLLAGHATVTPLAADSPAIDSGLCVAATGPTLTADQRGYIMPWDGDGDGEAVCDMGAYEYGSQPANRLLLPLISR